MSGAVSNFDITGTMWMVSVVFLVGMKSWWHFQMAGFMLPAFGLAYIAKWVRRSNVLTGAEWMITRFGDDRGGRVARYSYASLAVVTCTSFIGYAFQGIGKFAKVYLPLGGMADYLPIARETLVTHEGNILALLIFTVTTPYIVLGGLFGVVITDCIQTLILGMAALLISYIAYTSLSPGLLESKLPEDFNSLIPVWRMVISLRTPKTGSTNFLEPWSLSGYSRVSCSMPVVPHSCTIFNVSWQLATPVTQPRLQRPGHYSALSVS